MHLVLASQSPYRRKQMEDLGLRFESISPGIDEEALKKSPPLRSPHELCLYLAESKARGGLEQRPDAIVIGSDQMAVFGTEVLGKPGNEERAVEQLLRLQGQTHQLITSIVVLSKERRWTHLERAWMQMRPLTEAQVRAYVRSENPTDCAGAYKIEARGLALFQRIEVGDFSSIIGLPMMALTSALLDFGYPVFE